MSPMRFDQLLYDTQAGEHVFTAATKAVRFELAGIVFNDVIVRRENLDTADDMVRKYRELTDRKTEPKT